MKNKTAAWTIRFGILLASIGLALFLREFISVNPHIFSSDSENSFYFKVVPVEGGVDLLNWQWIFLLGILFIVGGLILRRIFKNSPG